MVLDQCQEWAMVEPDNLEMQTVSMIRLLGEGMVFGIQLLFPLQCCSGWGY